MKRIISLFVLAAAVCFGQHVSPVPHKPVVAHWFNTRPVPKDAVQNMVDHADTVFSVIHDEDLKYCENGPINPDQYPEVKRCEGVI